MIKLLIVDDEMRTREGLCNLIGQSNLPVEIIGTAANGIDALSIAETHMPDILITDVRMPKLDGIKLSFEIKKHNPDSQIIFISGYSDKEYLKSAITLKAIGYVEKPVDSAELLDAVKAAIEFTEKKNQKNLQSDIILEKAALEMTHVAKTADFYQKLHALIPEFFRYTSYCTVICQFRYRKDLLIDSEEIYKRLKWFFSLNVNMFLSAQKRRNIFIIHIADNRLNSKNTLCEYMQHMYRELKASFADCLEPFIAVGSTVSSPDMMFHSYTDAVVCLKKLFFTGYNHLSVHNEKEPYSVTSLKPDAALLENYTSNVKQGNSKKVYEITNKLFTGVKMDFCKYEANSIKNIYYQFLMVLNSTCEENKLNSVFSEKDPFIWETVSKTDTLLDLHNYLMNMLSIYFSEISNKESTSFLVYRIHQYIENHFNEAELSINKMAEQLHFTPAYLCQVYKKKTGLTINAYLNTYRINAAKEFLRNEDIKLYEISYYVGYSDPNYFSRQFKKQTGMTPSEYREKYIK